MKKTNLRSFTDWRLMPPKEEYSGCIEATVKENGDLRFVRPQIFYTNSGPMWGFGQVKYIAGSENDYFGKYEIQKMVIADFQAWRFTGPMMPNRMEHTALGTCFFVWEWRDAPGELKALSLLGENEDKVVLCPPGVLLSSLPSWLQPHKFGSSRSSSKVSSSDDRLVIITAHETAAHEKTH